LNLLSNALKFTFSGSIGVRLRRERPRSAGFDDHLVKPVDLAALERALAATDPPQPDPPLGVPR
jgi:signal transduction histidine kinase